MSEVDRLSNSGLYPALPIADKRPSRDSRGPPHDGRQPPANSPAQADHAADPKSQRPPKSFIDEYV
jgi:hypothetical protein